MTKEELAVVQAAIRWHYFILANPKSLDPLANMFNPALPMLNELKRVTWQLATSCPECNAGGHTCPGDGVSIPHGAPNCGQHDDDSIENDGATRAELADLDVPTWHERTWVDVRTGDTVKLIGTENTAYVRHAVHQRWHVDPRSSEYRPVAMEWTAVHVELTAGPEHDAAVLGLLDMDPAKPILIQLTQSEVDAIELLGGWLNRVGMTMTEVPKP